MKRILFFLAALFLSTPLAMALKVSAPVDAGMLEPKTSYEFYVSLENDEGTPKNISLEFTPRSEYLEPYVTLEPNRFLLDTCEKEDIRVGLSFDSGYDSSLGPGSHTIMILPKISPTSGGVSTIATQVLEVRFSLPGQATHKISLKDFDLIEGEDGVGFSVEAKNNGNVREGARLVIILDKYYGASRVHYKTFRGSTQYLLSPLEQKSMSLAVPGGELDSGKYKAVAMVEYSGLYSDNLSKIFEWEYTEEEEEADDEESGEGESWDEAYGSVSVGGSAEFAEDTSGAQGGGDTPSGEKTQKYSLAISRLEAEMDSPTGAGVILVGIENLLDAETPYDIKVSIFGAEGESIGVLEKSGKIGGYAMELIEMPWSTSRTGDIRVEAMIEYEGGSQKKVLWTTIGVGDTVLTGGNTGKFGISGLFAGAREFTGKFMDALEGNKLRLILFGVIIILILIYIRDGKAGNVRRHSRLNPKSYHG